MYKRIAIITMRKLIRYFRTIKKFVLKGLCIERILTRSFPGLINGIWHGIKGQLVTRSQDTLAKHKEFIRYLSKKIARSNL